MRRGARIGGLGGLVMGFVLRNRFSLANVLSGIGGGDEKYGEVMLGVGGGGGGGGISGNDPFGSRIEVS